MTLNEELNFTWRAALEKVMAEPEFIKIYYDIVKAMRSRAEHGDANGAYRVHCPYKYHSAMMRKLWADGLRVSTCYEDLTVNMEVLSDEEFKKLKESEGCKQ